MDQPRTDLGKAPSKSRSRSRLRSPETVTAHSSSPLEALVKGLVSVGERFFKGRAPAPDPLTGEGGVGRPPPLPANRWPEGAGVPARPGLDPRLKELVHSEVRGHTPPPRRLAPTDSPYRPFSVGHGAATETPLLALGTRFEAWDQKATYSPSAETADSQELSLPRGPYRSPRPGRCRPETPRPPLHL